MEYWEEKGKRRHPSHPVVNAYALPKLDFIQSYIELKTKSVLDVGCGNGYFTYYFDRITDTIGLDASSNMLGMNPCKKLVVGDASVLPFRDSSVGLVFCGNLLHHIETPDTVIKEMARVSNEYVVIVEPNRNNPLMALFAILVKEERRTLKFTLGYIKQTARAVGLSVIASSSMGMIAPNKTPSFLLPILSKIDGQHPLGLANIVICGK